MDFGLSVLYRSTGNVSFYQAGAYCLWTGAAVGLLAIVTGLFDLAGVPRTQKKALALGLYHGFVNGLLLLVFSILAYRSWQVFPSPFLAGTIGVVVKALLVAALFAGNYLGGRLVYTHHLGIDKDNNRPPKPAP